MRELPFLPAKRMVFCLGLIAVMSLASGCGDADPVKAVGPEVAKATGEARQKARQEAYGKAGVPVGRPKPSAPPPAPSK